MNKICTDIEQSKKLMELGIDINTADMYYDVNINSSGIQSTPIVAVGEVWHTDIPAWSLTALLGLMPITCVLGISNGYYRIASNETNTFFHNNPLDAAFEMVCWLKENGKI